MVSVEWPLANSLLPSYLNGRSQYVSFASSTSTNRQINYGIPQSSFWVPFFSYLYVNDLALCLDIDRQLRGASILSLGTNNQVSCDILRQTPSAKSDFCRISLDAFGRNNVGPMTPQKTASISFLSTTWNLVETKAYIALITKWYVTEIYLAALPPAEAAKVRVMTSQKYASVPFVGTT